MRKKKIKIKNPDDFKANLENAFRYYQNGINILKRQTIKNNRYEDPKYVSEASGIIYLAALKAIDAYLLSREWNSDDIPQSIDHYRIAIKQTTQSRKLIDNLNTAYENLHIFAYYRGGCGKGLIEEGCSAVKNIIEYFKSKLPT